MVFSIGLASICSAQTLSTKETKVIVVVDATTELIKQLVLFNGFEGKDLQELPKRYPDSKFYLGLFSGNYDRKDRQLLPATDATLVIYTERQLIPNERLITAAKLTPGEDYNLGETRARVITNKKGELTLKIK